MLYYLAQYIEKLIHPPGIGLFRFVTFRAAGAALTALLIALWLGPKIIASLKRRQIGEQGKREAPKSHMAKAGTPTMGGLIVLLALMVPVLLWCDVESAYVILATVVTLFLGGVGFLDDYLKVVKKLPKGLIGRYKIIGQLVIGFILGAVIYFFPNWFPYISTQINNTATTVPFLKNAVLDFGIFYIPFVMLVITATSNAVNLTDGLDGLAIGTVSIVALALAVITYLSGNAVVAQYLNIPHLRGADELTIFCAAMVGAGLGFLWYNAYPAQVFMGDTGSLALGGTLAALALFTNTQLLLAVLGGLYVVETLSVILQVASFRLLERRVFKMAPIHLHFELSEWPEFTVIVRFWILAGLAVAFGLGLFYAEFLAAGGTGG
jgi:phospho-N-acetylmuramoyl-pentapeptide-transferase